MSSQPPETETHEVTLSTDEQWVVHSLLTSYLDDAIDADEQPPAWTLEVFETIEAGDDTELLTGYQARRLSEAMTAYVDCEEAPEQDIVHGSNVVDRLEESLESREQTPQ